MSAGPSSAPRWTIVRRRATALAALVMPTAIIGIPSTTGGQASPARADRRIHAGTPPAHTARAVDPRRRARNAGSKLVRDPRA
jgi:hypothetical protein